MDIVASSKAQEVGDARRRWSDAYPHGMVRSSFVVQSFILLFPLCALSAAVFEIADPPHLHSAGRDPPPSRPSERFPGSTELGEEEKEEKEAAASSSLDRPEDETTCALLRPCSTSPPGKGTGAAKHGKRGAVDRPGW